jgi:hypothetical protein
MTFSTMTLSKMTLSMMTFSIITLRINVKCCCSQRLFMLSVVYAECRYSYCRYAECLCAVLDTFLPCYGHYLIRSFSLGFRHCFRSVLGCY